MDTSKKNHQINDIAGIIAESLQIKQSRRQPAEMRSLLTELFTESSNQDISMPLITSVIDELRTATDHAMSQDAAAAGRTELIGELYQIAIEQAEGAIKEDMTRDLTFFYLAAGLNDDFIQWSDVLLNTIQQNNIEYRATLFAIGAAQMFVNQWEKAKESFNRILKDYPDAAEAYFGLALTYLKLGDTIHFQNALELARRLAPDLGRIIDRLSVKGKFSVNDYMIEMNSLGERND